MNRLVAAALTHRRMVVALFVLFAVASLPAALRLEVDNSAEQFYPRDDPAFAAFAELESTFGSTRTVRAVLAGDDLWSRAALDRLAALEGALAALPDVAAVDGPIGHHRRELDPASADFPARLRALVEGNALDRAAGLASADGTALSVVVTLKREAAVDAVRERQAVVAIARRLAADLTPGSFHLAGLPVLDAALDRSTSEILRRFLPLLVGVVLLLLLVVFRDVAAVAVPFLFVLLVALPLFGAMSVAGVEINLVVAILPPVLFAVTIATALHLLIRCRNLETVERSATEATVETYREKGRAIFWTTLSTAAGFCALATSRIEPIRDLGTWGATGMLFAGAAAFTLFPCLLAFTASGRTELPERRLEQALERLGARLADFALRRRPALLTLFALVALAALAGIPRIRVESNALSYFPPDDPLRRAFAAAGEHGMGVAAVELVGSAPAGSDLGSSAALAALAAIDARLAELPGAISVLSVAGLLDDIGGRTPLARALPPPELRAAILPLALADDEGRAAVERYLSQSGRRLRISLLVPVAGYEAIDPLIGSALAIARAGKPELAWQATGELPLLLATQHRLLSTLARSLALALPALALIFVLLLGSVRDALFALLPNLWPLLVLLGGMGLLGVPVDLATAMVASIVAGLVVDDTIHTLAPFRLLRDRVGGPRAVRERLAATTPAFLITGLVLACGFGVCGFSAFAPIARFGQLSAATLLVALAADLLLVPALFGGEGGTRGAG
ncbi:MAG: RND family transporter [Thermoanaerobaculia bacterium]